MSFMKNKCKLMKFAGPFQQNQISDVLNNTNNVSTFPQNLKENCLKQMSWVSLPLLLLFHYIHYLCF